MEQYVSSLIGRYRSAGVLVDTNLLLLLFIGAHDRQFVERFPRTGDRFAKEDFDVLVAILAEFDMIITTPHVFTETSNLIGRSSGDVRRGAFSVYSRYVSEFMKEQHTPAVEVVEGTDLTRFGITDAAILSLTTPAQYLVLTDDFPLYNLLAHRGVDVLNFNQLRGLNYGLQ